MQRYVYILLFALVLFAPLLARMAIVSPQAREATTANAARLVVITPNNQDIRREFAIGFDRWHVAHYGQSVVLDYRTPGGTSDIERQLKSTYDAYRDAAGTLPPEIPVEIDVVWGGGDYSFNQVLKPAGILQTAPISPNLLAAAFPEPKLAGVRLYDATSGPDGKPTPLWLGVCLSSFGIMYNPDVFERLGLPAPQVWGDLTNERLDGFISLADPGHSGSAAVTYMMVLQRAMADAEAEFFLRHPDLRNAPAAQRAKDPAYAQAIGNGWKHGMGQLLLIAGNARYFTDSSEVVPTDVARGDAAAGMAIDFYARVTEQVVGSRRAQFVLPVGATAITPDPVAVLLGVRGERLRLAGHFIEFLLSPEGQRLWILKVGVPGGPVDRSLWRMPIRRGVYADRTGWEPTTDPFEVAHGFNERGEWMVGFGDTRMIWGCAWIDSGDALSAAYSAVLSVSDDTRRREMINGLMDLPITWDEVKHIGVERARQPRERMDEWDAELRIQFARRFRDHYRAVKCLAENR